MINLFLILYLFIFEQLGLAWQLNPPDSIHDSYSKSELVFSGKIIEIKTYPNPDYSGDELPLGKAESKDVYILKFEVDKQWKGVPQKYITVESSSFIFKKDDSWLVYARRENSKLVMGEIRSLNKGDRSCLLSATWCPSISDMSELDKLKAKKFQN